MLPRNPSSGRSGFTLIEILVVVVVLAITAALVLPNALDSSGFQAVSAARLISADIEYAQNYAITSQGYVSVWFYPSNNNYMLLGGTTSTSPPLQHPINQVDYVTDFKTLNGFSNLVIVSANFGGVQVLTFDATGSPTMAGQGSVVVRSGSCQYQVTVAPATGRVSVAPCP